MEFSILFLLCSLPLFLCPIFVTITQIDFNCPVRLVEFDGMLIANSMGRFCNTFHYKVSQIVKELQPSSLNSSLFSFISSILDCYYLYVTKIWCDYLQLLGDDYMNDNHIWMCGDESRMIEWFQPFKPLLWYRVWGSKTWRSKREVMRVN